MRAICVILFVSTLHSQTSTWRHLPSGLEIYQISSAQNVPRSLTVLRIDPRRFDVLTVSPTHELTAGAQTSYSYSLRDLAEHTSALVLSNGGATASYNIPIPDGLLRADGVELSPLNDHHPGGGVFCVSRTGQAEIVGVEFKASDPHSFDRCRSAVQAGPLLVFSGQKVKVGSNERWERTAVAVDSAGRVLLIFSEPVALDELTEGLLKLHSALQIQSALNLDGGFSSGLMYQAEKQQYQQVGNTKTLVGSAILVQPGSGSRKQVIVPAKEKWTNTFVEVQQGQTISFSATGQIQWTKGKDGSAGPGGSTWKLRPRLGSYPVQTMGAGGLIGKIGNKGAPFAVGEKATITAPASGTVFLGINDNFFTENSGQFLVMITK